MTPRPKRPMTLRDLALLFHREGFEVSIVIEPKFHLVARPKPEKPPKAKTKRHKSKRSRAGR